MMKLNIQLFAISKSTSFSETIDVANNKSSLTITITFSANNTSTWFSFKTLYCSCNGVNKSANVKLTAGGKVNQTFTFSDIAHNDDGSKSVNWDWSIATGTSVLGTLSDSGTRMLTTIPRASDITASNADIGSSTIIVINKKASSFTTTIDYKFENETSWTNIVTKTSTTTYGWTLPESFYNQIPNKKYGVVTLRATTYDGSTQIGDVKTTTLYATANEELCKPVISDVGQVDTCEPTVQLTGDNTKFIRYESSPFLSWEVTAKNGATITSQKLNGVEVTSPYSPLNWSDSYTLVVTDSRGYQTTYDFNLPMVNYFYPSIVASGKRGSATSSKILLSMSGKFFNSDFGAAINTATFTCKYKKKTDTDYTTITLSPTINTDGTFSLEDYDLGEICDYQNQWQFSITVVDKLSIQSSNFTITKGNPIFYWYSVDDVNYVRVKGNLKADTEIKIGSKKVLGFNEVETYEET